MFREFNVRLEDVEMLGGTDNLLENTKVTKVIMRGDNKLSSLDSTFKNCSELDTIDGAVDIRNVGDLDFLTEGSPLIKNIEVKNPTSASISCEGAFNVIDNLTISGDYTKTGVQDIIASKPWDFEGIKYGSGDIASDVSLGSVEVVEGTSVEIVDALEQKAKGLEVEGLTLENIIVGGDSEFVTEEYFEFSTVGDTTLSYDETKERNMYIDEVVGESFQNLITGGDTEQTLCEQREVVLTDSSEFDSVEGITMTIDEIQGNTYQGYARAVSTLDLVNHINGLGFSNVNYQYVDDRTLKCTNNGAWNSQQVIDRISANNSKAIVLKPNTTYSFKSSILLGSTSCIVNTTKLLFDLNGKSEGTFTTDSDNLVGILLRTPSKPMDYNFILVEGDEIPTSAIHDLEYIQSVGELHTDENGDPILDNEGNEQYKVDIVSLNKNILSGITHYDYYEKTFDLGKGNVYTATLDFKNGRYHLRQEIAGTNLTPKICILTGGLDDPSIKKRVYMKKGVTYYVSFDYECELGNSSAYGQVRFEEEIQTPFIRNGTGNVSIELTPSKDVKGMTIHFIWGGSYTLNIDITNFMISEIPNIEYVPPQSNKTTILLPQPLKKVGEIKYFEGVEYWKPQLDKLYFDYTDNDYYLKALKTKTIKMSTAIHLSGWHYPSVTPKTFDGVEWVSICCPTYVDNSKILGFIPNNAVGVWNIDSVICTCKNNLGISVKRNRALVNNGWNANKPVEGCGIGFSGNLSQYWNIHIFTTRDKYGATRELNLDGIKEFFGENEFEFTYLYDMTSLDSDKLTPTDLVPLNITTPLTISTYSDKTYVNTTGEVNPSSMTLNNQAPKFSPLGLLGNTQYTLQFNGTHTEDSTGIINLGGTTKSFSVTPTDTHRSVSITTPSTLTNETLVLSGQNGKVGGVKLFKGAVTQKPSYFEGIKEIGVDNGNGGYDVGILAYTKNISYINRVLEDINIQLYGKQMYAVAPIGNALNYTFRYIEFDFKLGESAKTGTIYISNHADNTINFDLPRMMLKFKTVDLCNIDFNTRYRITLSQEDSVVKVYVNGIARYSFSGKLNIHIDHLATFNSFYFGSLGWNNGVEDLYIYNFFYHQSNTEKLPSSVVPTPYTNNKITLPQPLRAINSLKDRLYWNEGKGHYCIEKKIADDRVALETPQTIDLPNLNTKYTFTSYTPKTYIELADYYFQPSKIKVNSNIKKYKALKLLPSKNYTVKLKTYGQDSNVVTVNLGGATQNITVEPNAYNQKSINITTPATLVDDFLDVSGTGSKVKEVMVLANTIVQNPNYFEGNESVGVPSGDDYSLTIDSIVSGNIIHSNTVVLDEPLRSIGATKDTLYWDNPKGHYCVEKRVADNMTILPTPQIIDLPQYNVLPRLYQRENTEISVSKDIVSPSKFKVEYNEIN